MSDQVPDFTVVAADDCEDHYEGSDDVPGEFRRLTEALGSRAGRDHADPRPAALRLRAGHRPPATRDRGALPGHPRDADDALRRRDPPGRRRLGGAGRARDVRSHRNEGDEPVELWAISTKTSARTRSRSTTSGRPRRTPPSTPARLPRRLVRPAAGPRSAGPVCRTGSSALPWSQGTPRAAEPTVAAFGPEGRRRSMRACGSE